MAYMSAVYLPLLISSATLIICIFSFIYLRTLLKSRTSKQFLKDEVLTEIREEVNMILGAIDEATERDISLIKERENELKSLLDEIDKRLKLYIREMENYREADEVYNKALAASPPPLQQNPGTYTELGKNRNMAAFPLPEFTVKSDEGEKTAPGPSSTADQIKELLRAGFPPPLIASRLGISISEVEFAAALYERWGEPISGA